MIQRSTSFSLRADQQAKACPPSSGWKLWSYRSFAVFFAFSSFRFVPFVLSCFHGSNAPLSRLSPLSRFRAAIPNPQPPFEPAWHEFTMPDQDPALLDVRSRLC